MEIKDPSPAVRESKNVSNAKKMLAILNNARRKT